MSAPIDIEYLKGWIGREESATDIVTPQLVARFDATLGTVTEPAAGAVAPLLIHLCLAPPAAPMDALGPDGHPARGGFLPPVPLQRRMWAGGAFTFKDDIRVGDEVTRRSRILDVTVKEGRTGTLCFVTVEHTIVANGRTAIVERQDIVYRQADGASAKPAAAAPAPKGEHNFTVEPTPTLLFRYSALTFNGHRIHYDAPYAREVENYTGLVVHGPLQATLLAHFAARIKGRRPATFSFRSSSTLFDGQPFILSASEDGAALRLWTARSSGPAAMSAEATFD